MNKLGSTNTSQNIRINYDPQNEPELQSLVNKYLGQLEKIKKIKWFHIPTGLIRKCKQLAGILDIMILGKGISFIELKSPALNEPEKWLTEDQKWFVAWCQKNKVPVLVSNNYKETIDFIEKNI